MRPPVHRIAIALLVVGFTGCTVHNNSPGGYTVSGTVSGLASGQQVILANDSTDNLTITKDGSFTFSTGIPYSQAYSVSVVTQPTGQTCAVTNGSGSSFSYNVSGVNVLCTSTTYTIGGTVTGLAAGAQLSLQNNGTDTLVIGFDGNFNFPTSLTYKQTYAVTLVAQPMGQTCTLTMGTGTVTSDVATVAVTCAYNLEPVVTMVSGLESNATLKLLLNGGDTLPVDANGTYMFTAKDAYSSPFVVTITGNQPQGQICTVEGGVGTVMGSVTVPIVCITIPYTTYVINNNYSNGNASNVALFHTYAGKLTPLPPSTPTASTGNNPLSIALDPSDHYAYVANQADGTVSEFSINSDGSLLPLSPATINAAPIDAENGTQFVAVSPNDNAVYALNGPTATVWQYTLGAGGLLSSLSPSTVATVADANANANPVAMTINSTGTFAYVVNQGDKSVAEFSMAVNGALTFVATTPTGIGPNSVALSPNGLYLYVTNEIDKTISQFSIAGGALTALSEGPIRITTGGSPTSVVVDPTSTYVYVAANNGSGSGNISEYTIQSDGSLVVNATARAIRTTGTPTQLAFDQTGAFLYSAENGVISSESAGIVEEYALAPATGALKLKGTVSLGSGSSAFSIATSPHYPPQ